MGGRDNTANSKRQAHWQSRCYRLSACLYAESDCRADYRPSPAKQIDSGRQPMHMTKAAL